MENRLRTYYFSFVKLIGIPVLMLYGQTGITPAREKVGILFLLTALFLAASCLSDFTKGIKRYFLLSAEILLAAAVYCFTDPLCGTILMGFALMDIICRLPAYGYLLIFALAAVPAPQTTSRLIIYFFLALIYFQNYKIAGEYKRIVDENLANEYKLKTDIEHTNIAHRDELKRSRLIHENEMLEEKSRISQALHDKLGHSINGSLYKLEAAKALIDKKPEESGAILQDVIDKLRGSMDEIRIILRNERPDPNRMAVKSLMSLLGECEEQYGIKTELILEPEDPDIPQKVWDTILDNAYEAVTNSLKYSGCDTISIRILRLNEAVRCIISDNGKGALDIEDGMGLQGMEARVRALKGYIDIEGANGFSINMVLPLAGEGR